MKEDVSGLKQDVSGLKQDVSVLKEDVSGLKTDVSGLKEDVFVLRENVQSLDTGLRSVKIFQENVIMPRLSTIEACYTDTYRRYQRNNEKMEIVFEDVDLLKKVTAEHSRKLKQLA